MSNGSPLPINPAKWLLNELSDILSPDQLASLLRDYNVVKTRYETASKLRQAQKELAQLERNRRMCAESRRESYDAKIERRRERVALLQFQLDTSVNQ